MALEAILVAALALPPVAFKPMRAEVVDQIRDFVRDHCPGAEISFTPPDQSPPGKGWEWVPLKWGGLQLWIKRPAPKKVHREMIGASA